MCDVGPCPATRSRPRWRRLYVVASLGVAALAVTELSVSAPGPRIALECAIAAGAWGAILGWVRANRVALDQLEWCDGTSKTITARVIPSSPACSKDCDAGAVVVVEDRPRVLEGETQERLLTVSS